ncbi:MAG: hypothetical protein JO115_00075 [Pseudonocardiales bacterium]|nr:hypothetical protein [Pseudonocardiales bacterium]
MTGKHHQPKPPWWRLGALWRHLRGRRHPVSPPRHVNEIVDGDSGLVHWATDEAFEQGLRERTGRYLVLCGREIPVASMVTPPGRLCEPCAELQELMGRA